MWIRFVASLMNTDRLILGTAQLGMSYGIANKIGQPDAYNARKIIQSAWKGGISFFDTAIAYGQSEVVLGHALEGLGLAGRAKIISKLPPDFDRAQPGNLRQIVLNSLDRLKVDKLSVLLFHREQHLDLLKGDMVRELEFLLSDSYVSQIGISVYTPAVAIAALKHPLIQVVQCPASIFDRRFEHAGIFDMAAECGKKIHVRSVILQGVLSMQPVNLPEHLSALSPALEQFSDLCQQHHLEQASAAVVWAWNRYKDAHIIFGAETAYQVIGNIKLIDNVFEIDRVFFDHVDKIIPPQEEALLNPSMWSK